MRSPGRQGQREFKVSCAEGHLKAKDREARQVSMGYSHMGVSGDLDGSSFGRWSSEGGTCKPGPRGWLWREGGKHKEVRGRTWTCVCEAEQAVFCGEILSRLVLLGMIGSSGGRGRAWQMMMLIEKGLSAGRVLEEMQGVGPDKGVLLLW